ncbi:MAG: hypothetical protein M1591_10135, partial [Deltaproteobacteria bacterium]|nr:hypothetical protein [Deltaproteobacteria bacterium]
MRLKNKEVYAMSYRDERIAVINNALLIRRFIYQNSFCRQGSTFRRDKIKRRGRYVETRFD